MLPTLGLALLAIAPPSPVASTASQVAVEAPAELAELERVVLHEDRRSRLAAVRLLREHGEAGARILALALGDHVAEVRLEAARALAALGPGADAAVDALIEAGSHEDEALRFEAWYALGRLGPAAAAPLAAAAASRDYPDSLRALLALGRLAADDPEVVAAEAELMARAGAPTEERHVAAALLARSGAAAHSAAFDALKDPDWTVRDQAAWALGWMAGDAPDVRAALIAAAGEDDARVRRRAVWALGFRKARDPEMLAALVARLEDGDPQVKHATVWALGRLGAPAVPILLNVERAVWHRAATALGEARPAAAEQELFAYIDATATPLERALDVVAVVQRWGPAARHLAPRLIRLLGHPRTSMRIAALRALNWTGYEELGLADALVRGLQNEDARIRVPAGAALGYASERADDVLLPMIRALREDPEPGVRATLAWVLGDFHGEPDLVVQALLQALEDEDPSVRLEAIGSLEQIGPGAVLAAPRLVGELRQEDPLLRPHAEAARSALLAIGAGAKDALMFVVAESDDLERVGSVMSVLVELKVLDDDELRELSRDERGVVRVSATYALLAHGLTPTKALKALIDGVKDRHDVTRLHAAAALASLGPSAKTAQNALVDALDSSPAHVRVELVRALGAVAGERRAGLQVLVQVLQQDPDELVCIAAANELGALGPQAKRAIPALVGVLEHEHPDVRAAAALALGAIRPTTRDTVAALRDRLARDTALDVRCAAARALGTLGADGAVAVDDLTEKLRAQPDELAECAALALSDLGPHATGAIPALVDRLLLSPRLALRVRCAEALERFGALAREAVPALIFALLDEGVDARVDALLTWSSDEGPPLRPFEPIDAERSNDASWIEVQVAAARALGAIGPDAAAARPHLERALRTGDDPLPNAARDALDRVDGNRAGAPSGPEEQVLETEPTGE